MADDEKNEQEKDQEVAVSDKLLKSTITTKTAAAMLTASFHVKEVDQILCYLYINGQYLRFMPDDVVDILPRFFVKSGANRKFLVDVEKDKEEGSSVVDE